ncbi:MAG: mechanosensitive ion channel family protein [Gammaproteobacteria bacterium]|nr:mechanosensitive ion channel family protein [Gammaproteobacteria bacterium]
MKDILDYKHWDIWVSQVLAVIVITILVNWLQRRIIARAHLYFTKTATLWDDALIEALKRPLSVLIWIVGLAFAANIVERSTGAAIFSAVAPLRDMGVIVIIAWFLLRFINNAQREVIGRRIQAGEAIDRTTVDAVTKVLRITVVIIAALVMFQTLGYSISGILAFGGIGGIAVGFAAKDLLANFFGGLMIYLDRPFAVGDQVRSPDRNIEGTIETIGWRQTCIMTPDKRPLYVPNSVFANIAVENPSRMSHRRISETIGLRYEDAGKIDAIVDDIREMLRNSSEVDHKEKMIISFNAFGPSSLDILVSVYTPVSEVHEYHRDKHKILLAIYSVIRKHGADIAFPTSTIHIANEIALKSAHGQALTQNN